MGKTRKTVEVQPFRERINKALSMDLSRDQKSPQSFLWVEYETIYGQRGRVSLVDSPEIVVKVADLRAIVAGEVPVGEAIERLIEEASQP